MAAPELVQIRDFTTHTYAQRAEDLDSPGEVLAVAEQIIQDRLRRKLKLQTYTERFRASKQRIFVRNRPIVTVTSLKRRLFPSSVWETLDISELIINKESGYITVPIQSILGYEVEIIYTGGFTTIPLALKEAIILQAVLLASPDFEVYGSGDSKEPGYINPLKETIEELIAPWRLSGMAYGS